MVLVSPFVLSPIPLTSPFSNNLLSRKVTTFPTSSQSSQPGCRTALARSPPPPLSLSLSFLLLSSHHFLFLSDFFSFEKSQEDFHFKMIARNESKRNDKYQSPLAVENSSSRL